MRKLTIGPLISKNITSLVDIRDSAIHFFQNRSLKYVIYTLGVAALRNYQRLMKNWFDRSLLEYNFYIMPLAFAHDFVTLQTIDLDRSSSRVEREYLYQKRTCTKCGSPFLATS